MTNENYSKEEAGDLMVVLGRHVGKEKAIGMDALYKAVYDKPVRHKINDTRKLRDLITALQNDGVPIASSSSSVNGGYYLAAEGSELNDYIDRVEHRGMAAFRKAAKLRKQTLKEYFGQLLINLRGDA